VEGGTRVSLVLVEVEYDQGLPERYFVPLAPDPSASAEQLSQVDHPDLNDALLDPACARALLVAVRESRRVATSSGAAITFERGPDFERLRPVQEESPVRPLGVEQSNSSLVFGESLILKCFRRVYDGPNPDLELPRFLATRTGFDHLPRLAGWIDYTQPGGSIASLGLLQEFVQSEGDGWIYTLRALGAEPTRLRDSNGYRSEVAALGRLTAELHLALASGAEPDFAPEPIGADDVESWRDGIVHRMADAFAELEAALGNDAPTDARTPPIRELAARALAQQLRLTGQVETLRTLETGDVHKTRYHGDYHLGQVLKTGSGWIVLDFEGEPLRSLEERRAKHCPLKDVAGMLRSFSYARQTAARQAEAGLSPGSLPPRNDLLAEWERLARAAFLDAYLDRAGSAAPFLPRDPGATLAAITAFELEKAVYELQYELHNRPAWIAIPLHYLARPVRP
jgi:maltose alpha-D-glucosyltransferase/alpha-amylase